MDLDFANLFRISENTLRTRGSYYIEKFIGVPFRILKSQALGIQPKNYLDLAVKLLKEHIDLIGSSRVHYNKGRLVVDLLSEDFQYSESSLRSNAERFLKKFTGYTWEDLVKFAKANKLPD